MGWVGHILSFVDYDFDYTILVGREDGCEGSRLVEGFGRVKLLRVLCEEFFNFDWEAICDCACVASRAHMSFAQMCNSAENLEWGFGSLFTSWGVLLRCLSRALHCQQVEELLRLLHHLGISKLVFSEVLGSEMA